MLDHFGLTVHDWMLCQLTRQAGDIVLKNIEYTEVVIWYMLDHFGLTVHDWIEVICSTFNCFVCLGSVGAYNMEKEGIFILS